VKIAIGIATKLIIMVTLIVITAIGVVVGIATDLFREESVTRVQEMNLDSAHFVADQVFSTFKSVTEKMSLMTETVAQAKGSALSADAERLIQNILRSNDDLLSFAVYRPDAQGNFNEIYFSTKSEVLAELSVSKDDFRLKPWRGLLDEVKKHPNDVSVVNASPVLKIPILSFGFLTKESAETKERWLIRCEIRQESLIKIFSQKSSLTSYMVDRNGLLLVHADPKLVLSGFNFSNCGCTNALVNWRARSLRKLKKKMTSLSLTFPIGSPSSFVTTVGKINSSVSPRLYA
jgi:hypothetical protein